MSLDGLKTKVPVRTSGSCVSSSECVSVILKLNTAPSFSVDGFSSFFPKLKPSVAEVCPNLNSPALVPMEDPVLLPSLGGAKLTPVPVFEGLTGTAFGFGNVTVFSFS